MANECDQCGEPNATLVNEVGRFCDQTCYDLWSAIPVMDIAPPDMEPVVKVVPKTIVPELVGQPVDDAVKLIQAAKLGRRTNIQYVASDDPHSVARVTAQDLVAGSEQDQKSMITITYPKTQTNNSSLVPRVQLDQFIAGLVNNDDIGFPLFTISDCNSFHTSGYLWGLYAARMIHKNNLTDGAIAVVNFDQHNDKDAPGEPTPGVTGVASDRWGEPLVKALNDLEYDAVYVSPLVPRKLGRGAKTSVVSYGRNSDRVGSAPKGGTITDFEEFWSDVSAYLNSEIKYVFITIDRDVLVSNYNQWGDGPIKTVADLHRKMYEVLKPVFGFQPDFDGFLARGGIKNTVNKMAPKAVLIGFDVTGLPEHEKLVKWAGNTLVAARARRTKLKQGDNFYKIASREDTTAKEIRELWKTYHPDILARISGDHDRIPQGQVREFYIPPPSTARPDKVWPAVDEEIRGYFDYAMKLYSMRKTMPAVLKNAEWGKLVFFSGSISFGEYPDGNDYKKFDCWDFMRTLVFRLNGALNSPDWKFILKRGPGPACLQGWKSFSLYIPGVSMARTDHKRETIKNLCGSAKADLGGFAATAAVTDCANAELIGGPKVIAVHDLYHLEGAFAKPKKWECAGCGKGFDGAVKPAKCDRCSGFKFNKP